ncbi:M56 family metallopeptidase [Roseivirga spongicola]|uniref:M56 family metallopeptidase n=1 Tax=Roseivirga spongicola TaxID=333140 RepID=UPI002AC8EB15|nr:M56 family metallopeptidase [Roseivirga spongicola]WPZ11801.1 M56 family metallopeptidase [Roseivirga spongicola]
MDTSNHILEALGLSLVHSLWQGALLLFLVLLALVTLRNKRAKVRYNITLAGIALLPIILAFNLYFFWPNAYVENSVPAQLLTESNSFDLPTDFQPISLNQESNTTMLWLKKNASTIAFIWFVGVGLFFLKIIGSFIWMKRLVNNSGFLEAEGLNELLNKVKHTLSIRTKVQLRSSHWIKSPIILGVIRPTIFFPIGLIEGLSVEEVEAILYHELAHLKRNDFVINIIINVLQIVFFYHPAYWWMKSQLDNEREYATDELALKYSEKKLPMIKALAKVQAFSMNQPGLAFAGNSKNQVLKRINIMMNSKQQPNWLSATFTIAILLVAFGLMSVQDTQSKTKNAEENLPASMLLGLDSATHSETIQPSISNPEFDSAPLPQDNDSVAVSKAILEMVNKPKAFIFEFDENGELLQITKDGKELKSSELINYKQAYTKLVSLGLTKPKTSSNSYEEQVRNELRQREAILQEERNRVEKRLEQIQNLENNRDKVQQERVNVYQERLDKLTKDIIETKKVLENNAEIDAELEKRYSKERNSTTSGTYSLMQFPGGAENRDLFRSINIKYSLNGSEPLLVIDNIVIPGKKLTDLSDSLILKIRKVEFYTGNRMKEVIAFDKFNDYREVIRITNQDPEINKPTDKAQFILDENFEPKQILVNGIELTGNEKERALNEYRRHRELEFLNRESQKLNTLIQLYENQGMNDLEIKGQFLDALNRKDLLTDRISNTYQFIGENTGIPKINYASIGIQYKMDSLSINNILGNPNQSVFYLNKSNREDILNHTLTTLERTKVAIELNGKLKKDWSLEDIKSKLNIQKIGKLTIVKGKTMYNYHSKRKLGNASSLLIVETEK